MKKHYLKLLSAALLSMLVLFSCRNNSEEPVMEEKNYFNYTDFEFSFNQTSTGTSSDSVVHNTYEYNTIDQDGLLITCSGYYEFKLENVNTEFDLIIVDCHGTIMNNNSRPSNKGASFGAGYLGNRKAMIIAPDYLGYGTSNGRVHPYIVADINARNIIDAVLSIKLKSGYHFSDDCKTIIIGYSQGGQTSLATYKCIQNKIPEEYKAELNVQKCYSGAGPYNLITTMDEYLSSETIIAPFVYLVVRGYLSAHYDCLNGYKIEDFFTEEFLKSQMRKDLDDNNYSISLKGVDVPDGLIEAYLAGGYAAVMTNNEYMTFVMTHQELVTKVVEYYNFSDRSKLITLQFLDPSSKLSKAFRKALKLNNLTEGWKPETSVYIYHHVKDDMVPFENFEMLKKGMKDCNNIIFDKDEQEFTLEGQFDFVHGHAGTAFYERAIADILAIF
ncbi:MAG: hypothetical protein IKX23_04140 [Treponema sp.]|nr:hypothetical protein [Treponema sp.]